MLQKIVMLQWLLFNVYGSWAKVYFNENAAYAVGDGTNGYSCAYQDGKITENGVTRDATNAEKAEMEQYALQMEQYNAQMSSQMMNNMNQMFSQVFTKGFPFRSNYEDEPLPQPDFNSNNSNNIAMMPTPPVFCNNAQNA